MFCSMFWYCCNCILYWSICFIVIATLCSAVTTFCERFELSITGMPAWAAEEARSRTVMIMILTAETFMSFSSFRLN